MKESDLDSGGGPVVEALRSPAAALGRNAKPIQRNVVQ